MKRFALLIHFVSILVALTANAAEVDGTRRAEELKLKDLRWGMFICWSFSTFSGQEWTPGVTDVSFFKATGCDTEQWVRTAKEAGMGYILFLKKSQLKELLTQYGPVEYIWFDHAVGDGGLSHPDTIAWCKSFQPNCFIGFNHGDQTGADIRLGEMGRPGPLDDPAAAGPHLKDAPSTSYRLAEFTYPILPPHEGGAMWFYSLPIHDTLCHPAEKLYRDYLGAANFGNIFSLDVGPDYAGRLRAIDVQTLREVGEMIRGKTSDPSVPPPLELPPRAQPVPAKIEIADGPFQPAWESLQQYRCPE